MKFFELETLGDLNDAELLFLDQEPEVMGLDGYCLAAGERLGDGYPEEVKLQSGEDRPGIQLSSVLGNNFNYLIVCSAMKDVIAATCPKDTLECLPFTLLDPRGRVRSQDYFFINPIGGVDGVDAKASDIKYHRSGAIVGIRKLVLDPEKLRGAPSLFRLQQDLQLYVVSEPLARTFQERGFSNVVLRELAVSTTS
ncbi:hypothetical protein G4177_07765 [Corallococcus sp. ZKHCc1 1396]|uniref:Immunity MXAN-0049 protein domain-containing protein n=1 Tax=Corallococcus soli TaxID=2710757 RepID=A0ABR9PJM9_9BACT|nr:DUF1629 domain-containing protein [Corallococcus soli]MBE4748075.1 hypothetical protein [Corallococcus soli]